MRNLWRLLLRHHPKHQVTTSFSSSSSARCFSSLLPHGSINGVKFNPPFPTHSHLLFPRHFSTSENNSSDQSILFLDIFSKPINGDEIKSRLESNNVVITHDLVLNVLGDLKSNPDSAIRFFDWVSERDCERLSSKAYNSMLKILANNGFVKEFWDMVDVMKKKGYGVSKGAFIEASKKFEEDGWVTDLEKLKSLFSNEMDVTRAASRVSKIVRKGVWDDAVERELRELGVEFSSELVKIVLEKISSDPMKALIFFRWVEESGLCKHDGVSYNAMAVVLGREDCLDRFWNVLDEMQKNGLEMEVGTYVKVVGRFLNRRMLEDAVGLYEFAMNNGRTIELPNKEECTLLLRKISTAKENFDASLFSRVVSVFTEKGFSLEDSILDSVLKSLTSGGRMSEYNTVLQAMFECGFKPSGAMQARVAFDLASSNMQDESDEFVRKLEARGMVPDYKMWSALVEGHCVAGNLDKARVSLQMMIDNVGISNTKEALDMLVNAYCNKHRAADAYKVLADLVTREGLEPWHATYKTLVSKLLLQGGFRDALSVLGLMKNHGFPPFLDPYIAYLSRKGTVDEGMLFLKGMTVNNYPSTSVFLRLFEAFAKAKRHAEAQDLLGKCPQYIRNNADVLNLFCSMKKPGNPVKPDAVPA